MYLFRKKLITVVFELKLSGSLRLTLFSSVSVFWRRKGEERGWRVLGFKTPHSCLTWTRTTEHTDTGRHTPYVHFYPWSTISTAHDYIHVYPHLCNKTVEFYPWSHFKLPSCIGCIPYLQIHKIVQFTGCVRTCYFFFFFFFAHFLKNVENVLWMSSNADKDGQVFKKNLWDFFLHFDPGSKRRYSYWTSSDSRNHCSLSANQMKWLFNELFRSNSCHRVECMSHLFCTAILYILWMDKNKRFWLCVLVCVCVNEDFEHFRV